MSILHLDSLTCPTDPDEADEEYRVMRPGNRNRRGSNLEPDQPVLRCMFDLSRASGETKYADFARRYASFVMEELIDEKDFFWWGWHRHYDVHNDDREGHLGNPHEIHAIREIDWEHLWEANPTAVADEITAIWKWHVIDKGTGEVNRHGDGERGCDFSMSAGAFIEAFAFMHSKTGDEPWLDRARLLADYYWSRRNPETDLFPDRPNAGSDRFDGSTFVTSITGLHCFSLLKAWHLTREERFLDRVVAYLEAYGEHGYDEESEKFWGALRLDGTPIRGPRVPDGYARQQPRGHLELWQPYVMGYEYPIYTAQCYALAYHLTGNEDLLRTAERFADPLATTPPDTFEHAETAWYREYCEGPGCRGSYAGKYGRTISFYLHMCHVTGDRGYLNTTREMAESAIETLWHDNELFRGHPAKPYYESIDGVGNLLRALLQLGAVIGDSEGEIPHTRDGESPIGRDELSFVNK